MVTVTIILLFLFVVAILPASIEIRFTSEELAEMGIHLDLSSTTEI